jgi:hypothetical protein
MTGAVRGGATYVAVWAVGGVVSPAGLVVMKFDSLTGSLLGSAIFILALVLSGTLSQYIAGKVMPL